MQTTEWNFWANLFMLAQFMMILLVGMRVMLTRHPPGSSFAWLLITAALPVAGFLLYLFIGERPLARFRLLRVKRLLEHYYPWAKDRLLPYGPMPLPLNEYEPLLRLSTNLARLPLTVGNRLTLLPTSLEAFERILEDIRKAERQIELAYTSGSRARSSTTSKRRSPTPPAGAFPFGFSATTSGPPPFCEAPAARRSSARA